MADFHKAFEAIDEDGSGEITVDELQHYMIKNNYKASFVSKWLTLFDGDKSGKITYEHYCETLGLVPKEREPLEGRKDAAREDTIRESRTAGEAGQPPKRKEEEIKPIKTTGEATQPSKTATETVRPAKTTGEATQPSKTATETVRPAKTTGEATQSSKTATETVRPAKTTGEATQPSKTAAETVRPAKTTGEATQSSKTAAETVRQAKTTDARTKPTADSADAPKSAPVNPQPDPQSRTVPSKAVPSNKKAASAAPTTTTTKEKMTTVDSSTDDGVVPMDTQEDRQATKSIRRSKRHTDRRCKSFRDHKRTLRPSIAPGVILILLTGIHRGKRVVFLKQLASGLLLVTGPFRINGCPLRRVHQRFVIATGTRLDISGVPPVPDHITDEYFSRRHQSQSRSSRRNTDRQKVHSDVTNIFAKSKKQYELKDERKADQKSVDAHIITAIRNREDKSIFARYLRSLFTLSSHDLPHKMQF